MPRFFDTGINTDIGSKIEITGENARHISFSLRMRPGEQIVLCDGRAMDYLCEITEIIENSVFCDVLDKTHSITEPKVQVHIYQCIPKSDKMELIIKKCTELGAVEFTPVSSSRCISKMERGESKKLIRMQKIAAEAAKQSGRGVIPVVNQPMELYDALEKTREENSFFLYEGGGAPLRDLLISSGDKINIFIGPEGGFSDEEAELAGEMGAKKASLGKRILRTETAPIAVTAAIMYERGEWA